jgi:hypothetical protein
MLHSIPTLTRCKQPAVTIHGNSFGRFTRRTCEARMRRHRHELPVHTSRLELAYRLLERRAEAQRGEQVTERSRTVVGFCTSTTWRRFASHKEASMQFILVNGRSPRPQSFCTLCCEPIQDGYVREIPTQLSYCSIKCYVDHRIDSARVFENHARAS